MNQNLCHICEPSDYQNSNPRNKFIEFSIHISSTSVKCSNKSLLEENQHVVMENNECQYGEEGKIIADFKYLDHQKSRATITMKFFFRISAPTQKRNSDWDLDFCAGEQAKNF